MVENIERLLDRDEKLNLIAMKSNNLNQRSKNVNYLTAKIKKQEKMKQLKMMMMVAAAILVKYIFNIFYKDNDIYFFHHDLLIRKI
jgi:hypothetical protein